MQHPHNRCYTSVMKLLDHHPALTTVAIILAQLPSTPNTDTASCSLSTARTLTALLSSLQATPRELEPMNPTELSHKRHERRPMMLANPRSEDRPSDFDVGTDFTHQLLLSCCSLREAQARSMSHLCRKSRLCNSIASNPHLLRSPTLPPLSSRIDLMCRSKRSGMETQSSGRRHICSETGP